MIRVLMFVLALLTTAPVVPAAALELAPTQAQPRLTRIPLTLATRGGVRRYTVEVAATPREQELGLMFRTRMGANEGMIFPFAPPRPASFWMENTVLPLDLVFIGGDGRVLNIAADAKPYSKDLIWSQGAAAAVLELNAGEAARAGVQPGDVVSYKLP